MAPPVYCVRCVCGFRCFIWFFIRRAIDYCWRNSHTQQIRWLKILFAVAAAAAVAVVIVVVAKQSSFDTYHWSSYLCSAHSLVPLVRSYRSLAYLLRSLVFCNCTLLNIAFQLVNTRSHTYVCIVCGLVICFICYSVLMTLVRSFVCSRLIAHSPTFYHLHTKLLLLFVCVFVWGIICQSFVRCDSSTPY